MSKDRLETIFDELTLENDYYHKDTFVKQYKHIAGLDGLREDIKPEQKYAFVYIVTDPEMHIYNGWS